MVKRADDIIRDLETSAERMKRVRQVAEEESEIARQQEAEPQPRNISITPSAPIQRGQR
jgi:hypothetical protein